MEISSTNKEESHRDVVAKYRVELVQSIDPDRQFLFSYLISKMVFDDEDCELIQKSGTRQQKVSKLLDALLLKGPGAFRHFVDALEYEHPHLFEKIAGKKASVSRMVPSPIPLAQKPWDFTTGLAGKELLDFDRQYLAQQLEKATSSLQSLSYVHTKTLKEKNSLEQRLQESERDIEILNTANNDLKYKVNLLTQQINLSKKQNALSTEPLNVYMQEIVRENMEKSNMVIALQSRILSSADELESTKITLSEVRAKNESLMKQIKELVINYDTERRQSKRLNDKVRRQTDQARQVEEYKKENYELKYKFAEITAENEENVTQLEEFKKVTEALNSKCDMLLQEKEKALEYRNHFHGQYLSIEQQALVFEEKLLEATSKASDWQRKYERVQDELNTVKEQRDILLGERESSLTERNNIIQELNDFRLRCEELQESKNQAIDKQIEINKKLEKQYRSAMKELDEEKEQVRQFQHDTLSVQQDKRRIYSSEDVHADSEYIVASSGRDSDPEDSERKLLSLVTSVNMNHMESDQPNNNIIHSYPWKKRSRLDVLKSAYSKLEARDDSFQPNFGRLKRHSEGVIRGFLSKEQLEFSISEKTETKKSLTSVNFHSLLKNMNIHDTCDSNLNPTNALGSELPSDVSKALQGSAKQVFQSVTSNDNIKDNDEIIYQTQKDRLRSTSAPQIRLTEAKSSTKVKEFHNFSSSLPRGVTGRVKIKTDGHSTLHRKKGEKSLRRKHPLISTIIPTLTDVALGIAIQKSTENIISSSSPHSNIEHSKDHETSDSNGKASLV